jgi:hypothetical protein
MDEIIKKEAVYLAAYSVLKRWYENGNISKAVFERLNRKNTECQGCKMVAI